MNTTNKIAMAAVLLTSVALAPLAFAASAKNAQDFVQKAGVAGEFEIESSQLALQKSQDAGIKQFAQQMIDDHTKASNELKATIKTANLNVTPPTALDSKHQSMLDKLKDQSGADFDKKYVKEQTDAHKEAVSLFQNYAQNGDNAPLKAFAGKTLPTLQAHLQHVKQLKSSM